jgi:hypothetical protein
MEISKTEKQALSCVGVGAIVVTGILASSLVHGLVITKMWIWFIVPLFEIRPISIPEAIGLSMLGSLFVGQRVKENDEGKTFTERLIYVALGGVLAGLFTLILGWIVYQFV